jgi:predicted DNA-binding transcriptional regulator AlpA
MAGRWTVLKVRAPGRTAQPEAPTPIEPMLSIRDLCRILGIDRRTFERMRAAGRIPAPSLIVGSRSPRWRPEVIRTWVESGGRVHG